MTVRDHVRKRLLDDHDPSEVGVWRILGEDPNPELFGSHHEPELETVTGTYRNVVEYALNLPLFFQWGYGGRIVKAVSAKNVDQKQIGQPKLTLAHIQEALKDIKFMDRQFIAMEKGDGFLIQMSYMEADVDNPEAGPVEQKTRKWYASPYMTESELVETCWAMVCRSQMHVAGEHFTYKGRRVYSPHFDVQARIEMCDSERFDCREPIESAPK